MWHMAIWHFSSVNGCYFSFSGEVLVTKMGREMHYSEGLMVVAGKLGTGLAWFQG